jgi:hypothetical protein
VALGLLLAEVPAFAGTPVTASTDRLIVKLRGQADDRQNGTTLLSAPVIAGAPQVWRVRSR